MVSTELLAERNITTLMTNDERRSGQFKLHYESERRGDSVNTWRTAGSTNGLLAGYRSASSKVFQGHFLNLASSLTFTFEVDQWFHTQSLDPMIVTLGVL